MNNLYHLILKVLRKVYAKIFGGRELPPLEREEDPDKVSEMIYDLLASGKPCMIARYGSTELSAIVNYQGVKEHNKNIFKYIRGESLGWWWNEATLQQMQRWSGFFPPTPEKITQFCELMLEDSKEVDILGSWLRSESYMDNDMSNVSKIKLIHLDPYWSTKPWSRILIEKKVLVVHPFAEQILIQYNTKRNLLFKNKDVLPEFKSLQVVKAVQSLGGVDNGFKDWFEVFEYMKKEIDKIDYDVCLIGCGAYGFPLAAHVKRIGKQAVHIGGSLQLLFGIAGNRWVRDYKVVERDGVLIDYGGLVNNAWVRPDSQYKPKNSESIENNCYW